uniref:Uncharacterized protein n=1 Tax=Zea mays TaxID=4577 RepID=A0A804M6H4_MAIZE
MSRRPAAQRHPPASNVGTHVTRLPSIHPPRLPAPPGFLPPGPRPGGRRFWGSPAVSPPENPGEFSFHISIPLTPSFRVLLVYLAPAPGHRLIGDLVGHANPIVPFLTLTPGGDG